MAQADRLSEKQIADTYSYFEEPFNGRAQPPAPDGVELSTSYTRTMGRYFDGEKMVNH